jgi:hypothetical protein
MTLVFIDHIIVSAFGRENGGRDDADYQLKTDYVGTRFIASDVTDRINPVPTIKSVLFW